MKKTIILFFLCCFTLGYSQSLPIDFESEITTSNFVDFDGGSAMVIDNPQQNGINTSEKVAQIVRDGGAIWAGSKIFLASNLDFTTMNIISMKVFTTAPIGTTVKFKLEGDSATERDVQTTVTNEWEELTWDFTGTPTNFNSVVFMFDFGNVGDGSENSTFLFDDIEQSFGGFQIDWPVDFEDAMTNYTTTDFGGNVSALVADPTDESNTVVQAIKTDQAATWAGTTIGTPAGFATNLPLQLTDSKMTVRVWSPTAGTPIRLKVENSNDPTQTCETEVNTTLAGEWENIEFDFTDQAPGTQSLSVGLSMGWTYNMASIFFNFGTEGVSAGEQTYYFDDVKFGELVLNSFEQEIGGITVYPNPAHDYWTINSDDNNITTIEIFDMQGKSVAILRPDTKTAKVFASDFEHGMYFARISTHEGSKIERLIK